LRQDARYQISWEDDNYKGNPHERMITGTRYNVPNNFKENQADLEYSMRNCVIAILNGTIDADSINYTPR